MVVIGLIVGLLVGWLVNVASDYLPRYATKPPVLPAMQVAPAILGVTNRERQAAPWFKLHLALEVLMAVFFGWLGLRGSFPAEALVVAIAVPLFVLIALIDLKYRLVLNVVVYPAMVLAVIAQVALLHQDVRYILVGGGLAFGVFFLAANLRPGQLGGGDVKLALLMGLMFGFPQVLFALLVGAGAGGIAAVYLLTRRAGMKHTIPYAPFLCFGAIAVLLYHSLQMAA